MVQYESTLTQAAARSCHPCTQDALFEHVVPVFFMSHHVNVLYRLLSAHVLVTAQEHSTLGVIYFTFDYGSLL